MYIRGRVGDGRDAFPPVIVGKIVGKKMHLFVAFTFFIFIS